MKQPQCPHLPAELWSTILSHVDDLTLWVSCRQISKTVRAEAERYFATQRFEKLRIYWDAAAIRRHLHELATYTVFAKVKHLQRIDDTRATFSISILYQGKDRYGQVIDEGEGKSSTRHALVCNLLSNSDRRFAARLGQDPDMSQVCQMGPYFSDVPLPEASFDLDNNELSFSWKPFLDSFFGIYAHARHLARNKQCNNLDINAAEDDLALQFLGKSMISWSYRELWVESYGSASALGAFEDAYIERLKRSHRAEGVVLKPNVDWRDEDFDATAKKEMRAYLRRIWEKRNQYLIGMFMKEHGITHF